MEYCNKSCGQMSWLETNKVNRKIISASTHSETDIMTDGWTDERANQVCGRILKISKNDSYENIKYYIALKSMKGWHRRVIRTMYKRTTQRPTV